jgi:hypothetical protein
MTRTARDFKRTAPALAAGWALALGGTARADRAVYEKPLLFHHRFCFARTGRSR